MGALLIFHKQFIRILSVFVNRAAVSFQPLNQFVGQFRDSLRMDAVYRNRKYRFFACHLFAGVAFRESNRYIPGLTDCSADQAILKAGDKASGSDFQIVSLGGTAVECHSVNLSFIVNISKVSVLNGPVRNIRSHHVALQHIIDIALQIFIGYRRSFRRNFDAFIFSQRHIIPYVNPVNIGIVSIFHGLRPGFRLGSGFRAAFSSGLGAFPAVRRLAASCKYRS